METKKKKDETGRWTRLLAMTTVSVLMLVMGVLAMELFCYVPGPGHGKIAFMLLFTLSKVFSIGVFFVVYYLYLVLRMLARERL